MVSHMFVFYFGIMADLTPPVALAAFAASPIARASGMAIGMKSLQIAIAGFIVPFMAVYDPALMLQGDPGWGAVLYVSCKALLAVSLWGMGSIGFWQRALSWWERFAMIAAACVLVVKLPWTDEIGFAAGAILLAAHYWRARRALQIA